MAGREESKVKNCLRGPHPVDPKKSYLNLCMEDQMVIQGYRLNRLRQIMTWIFIFLTGGLLRLAFYWYPHWMLRCTHVTCSLAEAKAVLLQDQYNQWFVAEVNLITKDGTRVKVLETSPSVLFSIGKRQNRTRFGAGEDQHLAVAKDENLVRYFHVKKAKYIWDQEKEEFWMLRGLEDSLPCSYFHEVKGLDLAEQTKRRVLFGVNSIRIHVTPITVLLFKEVLSPFYVFQIFSCSVWFADEYIYYASCIVLISFVSIFASIYETRKMQRALRNTIQSSTVVSVCRLGDDFEEIPSEDLVPGDMIEIPRHGCVMQCDAVLVSGNCIVNESMLTGESVPVTKTPLPNPKFSKSQEEVKFCIKEHARHVLFCGTHVIQTRYYGNRKVLAVVVRTGFSTAKGKLVRTILYPKPVDFKFNRDTYIYIGILAGIAAMGLIYTVVLKVSRGETVRTIILKSLDLITVAVPPVLPAALTVGIVFSQHRLKLQQIYCISPRSINVCGGINAVCFDKTGTLTEDGMNMHSVVPVVDDGFEEGILDMTLLPQGPLLSSMATCHSLTIIEGTLNGDPLDLIMFEAIGWDLEEPGHEESRFDMMAPTVVRPKSAPDILKDNVDYSEQELGQIGEDIGIVRQFTFSSSLQRMSVITRKLGATHFNLYAKGSPEMIASLSKPETVPENFQEVLSTYTQYGYRVISLAWKPFPDKINYVKIQRMQREQVEKDLIFLGLVVMENRLKPETTPVICQLKKVNIRTVMVTGDNMLTAMCVARDCGMIEQQDRIIVVQAYPSPTDLTIPKIEFTYAEDKDKKVEEIITHQGSTSIEIVENKRFHFAITGKSWDIIKRHFPEIFSKIAVRGTIFARMSPEHKSQLIEALQELGYYVSMCGDGANDCGALKTAHAGISLSEAEASVASPFTSKQPNIECVQTVIREGRAALVTSFGIFKFIACCSLTQFVSVLILYSISANVTDFEFLYIDLFLLSTLSITFGRTEAYPELVKEPPPVSLTSFWSVLSLLIQMSIQIAAQIFCFFSIKQQSWFTSYEAVDENDYISFENTAIFYISMYQYIILAVAFSSGPPYRKSIFTNYLFLLNVIMCVAVSLWISIYPIKEIQELLELMPPPYIPYRLIYVGVASINCLLSILIETYILDNVAMRQMCHRVSQRCFPAAKQQYCAIEDELMDMPDWPPVSPCPTSPATGLFQFDISNPNIPKSGHNAYSTDSDSDVISLKSTLQHEDSPLLPDSHSENDEPLVQVKFQDGKKHVVAIHTDPCEDENTESALMDKAPLLNYSDDAEIKFSSANS